MSFWAEHMEELAIILNRVEASLNGRLAWVAAHKPEVHHAAPCCLLTLPEKANGSPLDGEGASTALVVNGDFFKLGNKDVASALRCAGSS